MRSVARLTAANVAWSRRLHSDVGLPRNAIGPPYMRLSVVAWTWNTGTTRSMMSPWALDRWCSSEFGGSMNDRECVIECGLWCALMELYVPRPIAADFGPPCSGALTRCT